MSDVTRILEAAQQGDPAAADQLLPLVYEELRRLATHRMANEAAEVLGISPRTAKYYWTHARAWLYREIQTAAN